METTRNQSSLQWHLTRLATELCLLILEYVVIGSHKSLAKRQMQKGVSYKKHLFMLLENTTPFAEVSGIVKKRYESLRQFHRIFLSLHNSFGCRLTNDFFCEVEKFDKISANKSQLPLERLGQPFVNKKSATLSNQCLTFADCRLFN